MTGLGPTACPYESRQGLLQDDGGCECTCTENEEKIRASVLLHVSSEQHPKQTVPPLTQCHTAPRRSVQQTVMPPPSLSIQQLFLTLEPARQNPSITLPSPIPHAPALLTGYLHRIHRSRPSSRRRTCGEAGHARSLKRPGRPRQGRRPRPPVCRCLRLLLLGVRARPHQRLILLLLQQLLPLLQQRRFRMPLLWLP